MHPGQNFTHATKGWGCGMLTSADLVDWPKSALILGAVLFSEIAPGARASELLLSASLFFPCPFPRLKRGGHCPSTLATAEIGLVSNLIGRLVTGRIGTLEAGMGSDAALLGGLLPKDGGSGESGALRSPLDFLSSSSSSSSSEATYLKKMYMRPTSPAQFRSDT